MEITRIGKLSYLLSKSFRIVLSLICIGSSLPCIEFAEQNLTMSNTDPSSDLHNNIGTLELSGTACVALRDDKPISSDENQFTVRAVFEFQPIDANSSLDLSNSDLCK